MSDQEQVPTPGMAAERPESTTECAEPAGIPLWGSARSDYLQRSSDRQLGPTEHPRAEDWVGFTVTYYEGADRGLEPSYIVALGPFFDLSMVYEACVEIADACLSENEYAYFERDRDLRKAPSPKAEWHGWKA